MFSAILAIMLLPVTDLGRSKGLQFRPLNKFFFFVFVANFLILMKLGACHVEEPFITLGQVCTALYFGYFVLIFPIVSVFENTLLDLALFNNKKNSNLN
jgi:ubiquinol-cytochrome c reductase cytochrome b subunit